MMTIGRLFRCAAVVGLAMGMGSFSAWAQPPAWTVPNGQGYPTAEVVLDLSLSDTTGIAGANLTVRLDDTAAVNFFKYDGTNISEKTSATTAWLKDENLVSATELRIVLYSNPPAALGAGSNVALAKVHFRVNNAAAPPATATVTLDTGFDTTVTPKVGLTRLSDVNGTSIAPTANAGTITVLAAPFAPVTQDFSSGQLDWTAVQIRPTVDFSENPPIKANLAGVGIGLKVTANGDTFGYFTSPDSRVPATTADGVLLRANWTLSSNQADGADAPAFRLRLNATDFSVADTLEVQSTTALEGGRLSPGTTAKVYSQYVDEPLSVRNDVGPKGYIANFDIESFNTLFTGPVGSTIYLHSLNVNWGLLSTSSPTPVPAFDYDFRLVGQDQKGWNSFDKTQIANLQNIGGSPFPNTAVAQVDDGLILKSENTQLSANPPRFSFAIWDSPEFNLTGSADLLYRLRLTIASQTADVTRTPHFRVRIQSRDFQWVRQFEVVKKQPDTLMAPSASGTEYFVYFAYPVELNGVPLKLSLDQINDQVLDDPNGGFKLIKTSMDLVPMPTFP